MQGVLLALGATFIGGLFTALIGRAQLTEANSKGSKPLLILAGLCGVIGGLCFILVPCVGAPGALNKSPLVGDGASQEANSATVDSVPAKETVGLSTRAQQDNAASSDSDIPTKRDIKYGAKDAEARNAEISDLLDLNQRASAKSFDDLQAMADKLRQGADLGKSLYPIGTRLNEYSGEIGRNVLTIEDNEKQYQFSDIPDATGYQRMSDAAHKLGNFFSANEDGPNGATPEAWQALSRTDNVKAFADAVDAYRAWLQSDHDRLVKLRPN